MVIKDKSYIHLYYMRTNVNIAKMEQLKTYIWFHALFIGSYIIRVIQWELFGS